MKKLLIIFTSIILFSCSKPEHKKSVAKVTFDTGYYFVESSDSLSSEFKEALINLSKEKHSKKVFDTTANEYGYIEYYDVDTLDFQNGYLFTHIERDIAERNSCIITYYKSQNKRYRYLLDSLGYNFKGEYKRDSSRSVNMSSCIRNTEIVSQNEN